MNAESKCPVNSGNMDGNAVLFEMTNRIWWPNQIDISILHQNSQLSNPMGSDFDYIAEFKKLDLSAVKADIFALMTDSQEWWPADYGHYGPLFIRMAWHSSGTYRVADGRGGGGSGTQRFAPLNSWPDNGNLDKARLLLWPIKQKYGRALSWGDLMILAGNCAIESMGGPTVGFGGGRVDVWEPELDINWGPEREWLGDKRYSADRELAGPLGAVQMGLIYVNPEGPNGSPDPVASGRDIRETFARMAMNDEETVALIAGGHAFGKAHGAGDPKQYVGPEPEGAPIEAQGQGWLNSLGTGNGEHTITSGIEGAWTMTPTTWDNNYLECLFGFDWVLTKSPAGAHQWTPKNPEAQGTVPDAHNPTKRHAPMMTTADLALRFDPIYEPIARRFKDDPGLLSSAFAEAWYKLTHRDMGPHLRLLGPEVPAQPRLWQDPVPTANGSPIDEKDIATLKSQMLASGLSIARLVKTAWASASTYRRTDMRGGANGARIRLAPAKGWAVNEPEELANALEVMETIQASFNTSGKNVSLADLIVLGGAAAIEKAAKDAGHEVSVPFTPGRTDALQAQTDIESYAVLEPKVDAFRNFVGADTPWAHEELLIDRAHLLGLTAPEMTVLLGGLRVLGANHGGKLHGVFTERPGTLTNDFFVNLLSTSMSMKWEPTGNGEFIAKDRKTGEQKYTATRVDLIFGSNSQLRALAEAYATKDASQAFVDDFVAAWTKVMNADRFDLA
ncbi:MAG: catalase/peroxidase HPI [Sphingorhabdus sp.]